MFLSETRRFVISDPWPRNVSCSLYFSFLFEVLKNNLTASKKISKIHCFAGFILHLTFFTCEMNCKDTILHQDQDDQAESYLFIYRHGVSELKIVWPLCAISLKCYLHTTLFLSGKYSAKYTSLHWTNWCSAYRVGKKEWTPLIQKC